MHRKKIRKINEEPVPMGHNRSSFKREVYTILSYLKKQGKPQVK